MRKLNVYNLLTLFLLFQTSRIAVTSYHQPNFENFNELEQAQIIEILKELNVYSRKQLIFKKTKLPEYIWGQASDFYLECYIELTKESFNPKYFKVILYHEIGHCFGLEHTNNQNDIMFASAKSVEEYKDADWKQFSLQLKSCF